MRTRVWIFALAIAFAPARSAAQESSGTIASVLQALRLPRATQEARVLGVPDSDIRAILDRSRERRLPAADVTELIENGNKAIREHGPIDNFGAFVQSRLDAGLRGRDLAEAIRAEHAAHGKGKGHGAGPDAAKGKGQPDAAKGKGQPDAAKGKGQSDAAKGRSNAETPEPAKDKKGGSR